MCAERSGRSRKTFRPVENCAGCYRLPAAGAQRGAMPRPLLKEANVNDVAWLAQDGHQLIRLVLAGCTGTSRGHRCSFRVCSFRANWEPCVKSSLTHLLFSLGQIGAQLGRLAGFALQLAPLRLVTLGHGLVCPLILSGHDRPSCRGAARTSRLRRAACCGRFRPQIRCFGFGRARLCCCSSVVEHSLGKGEVESSIPSNSTSFPR
jgi:hypothetical protein